MRLITSLVGGFAILACLPASPGGAQTKPAASAQAADVVPANVRTALDRMAEAMKGLKSFEIRANVNSEEVLEDGQKIQSSGLLTIAARRPDRLYLDLNSERRKRTVYYDGKQLTIYGPTKGYYATVAAPPTTRELISTLSDRYNLDTPLADLFEWGEKGVKLDDVKSAMYAGPDRIGDTLCEHYAFRQTEVDWQIWIRKDGNPLPCKIVITDTTDPSQPQTSTVFNWTENPTLDDTRFAFTAPEGSHRIELAQANASAAAKGTKK